MITSETVTIDGRNFELRLTRKGLRAAEAVGLNMDEIKTAPFSQIPLMFIAMTHGSLPSRLSYARAEELTDELFDSGEMSPRDFIEMFSEGMSELINPTVATPTAKKNQTKE